MTLDEFKKCDLRIGKITAAERIEGSEKLLKLSVDVGDSRQVVSGIGKAYTPEELIGKQIVIIANLDPRMMMGLESQGMLLAAEGADGRPVILTLDPRDEVAPGTKIT